MRFGKIYISQSINIQASKTKTISSRNLLSQKFSQNNSSTLFEPINGSSVKETMTVNGYNSTTQTLFRHFRGLSLQLISHHGKRNLG